MPYGRCIETWARERVYLGTQVPVTRNRAVPGGAGLAGRSIVISGYSCAKDDDFLILVRDTFVLFSIWSSPKYDYQLVTLDLGE